jgi:hypothetical protein
VYAITKPCGTASGPSLLKKVSDGGDLRKGPKAKGRTAMKLVARGCWYNTSYSRGTSEVEVLPSC